MSAYPGKLASMDFRHADNPHPFTDLTELRKSLEGLRKLKRITISKNKTDGFVLMTLYPNKGFQRYLRFIPKDIPHISNALIAFQEGREVDWEIS